MRATDIILILLILFLPLIYEHGWSKGYKRGFSEAGICAVKVEGEIECSYALSINKSYPDFYIDYNNIGGKANVLDIR